MLNKTTHNYHELMELRLLYRLLLLIGSVLAVYYPTIFSDICRVDDLAMIGSLKNTPSMSFRSILSIFVPHVHGGAYYRPILVISFFSDSFLFNVDPAIMHLENILLHALNTVLVFWLARQLVSPQRGNKNLIPLLSALLFGLHPINTESVDWISGRSDVLAGTFVLLSANMLLRFKSRQSYGHLIAAALFLFMGFLTKEVALAFLPGAYLILSAHDGGNSQSFFSTPHDPGRSGRTNLFPFFGGACILILYLALRFSAYLSHETRLRWTLEIIMTQPFHAFFVFLGAFGFYLKKLFLPFPLNFTITVIDPLDEIIAVPLLVLCLYIASQRTLRSALFIAGVLLIAPVFPLTIGKIAWTPYAERYLYVPAAFVMVASVSYVAHHLKKSQSLLFPKVTAASVWLLLALMMVGTLGRNITWMHNETLLKDSVEKSPAFQPIRVDYAYILAEQGYLQKARDQLVIAESYEQPELARVVSRLFRRQLDTAGYIDFGFAYLYEREGKIDKAIGLYSTAFQKTYSHELKVESLSRVVALYGNMLRTSRDNSQLKEIEKQLRIYGKKLYNFNGDAHLFYIIGKIYLVQGKRSEARRFLMMARDKFPDNSEYKAFSAKLMKRARRS